MALGHDGAEADEVAPGEQPLGLAHPGALGDDVAGPPAQHGIGQRAQVAELAEAERAPEDAARPARTRPAGWRRACRSSRRGASLCTITKAASSGTATWRVSRVAKSMWSACPAVAPAMASGSSRPTCAPGAALGLLAGAGQRQRIGVVAEGEQERHREGGARRQAGADGEGARHPDRRRRSGGGCRRRSPAARSGVGRAPGRCRPARSRRARRGTGPSRSRRGSCPASG